MLQVYQSYNKTQFKILDVGCNPPFLSATLARMDFEVIGIDSNPTSFTKTISEFDLNVQECNIETQKLPFSDNSFDCIVFTEVFEHLRIDPVFTVSELYRVLKRDGTLLFSTPNLYSLLGIFNFLFKGKAYVCATNSIYDEFIQVEKTGFFGHIREYTSQEILLFLTQVGFRKNQILYSGGGKKIVTNLVYNLFNHLRPNMMFLAVK